MQKETLKKNLIMIETKLWVYGKPVKIKVNDTINTTRRLHCFCVVNGIRNTLLKSQGGWYFIHLNGKLELMNRCLANISFKEYYDKAINN